MLISPDYREDPLNIEEAVVLAFTETGARAERRHSAMLTTAQEKLAAVVNAVADVVIGERQKTLYARTFSYTLAATCRRCASRSHPASCRRERLGTSARHATP